MSKSTHKVSVKALSTNNIYRHTGKVIESPEYKAFKKMMGLKLPRKGEISIPEDKKSQLEVALTFGVSNLASDLDNCLKSTIDCISKKYAFDDKRIFRLTASKEKVDKGEEFIEFSIVEFDAEAFFDSSKWITPKEAGETLDMPLPTVYWHLHKDWKPSVTKYRNRYYICRDFIESEISERKNAVALSR